MAGWYAVTRVVVVAVLAIAVAVDLRGQEASAGAGAVSGAGAVAGAGTFAGVWTPAGMGEVARETWDRLNAWDAQWMRDIAERGYFGLGEVDGDPGHWRSLAFFPLMPYLIRAVSFVTFLPADWAGALISLVAGVAFAFAAAALAGRMGAPRRAMVLASVAVTTAPMAVVMLMPYTEALFLALAGWGLVAVVDKRWGRAAVLFLLAGLTRSTALGLFLVLAVAVLAGDRRNPRAWAAVAVAPVGWAAYLAWSSARLSDAGGYFGAQARGWNSEVDGGAATLRWLWRSFFESRETGYFVSAAVIVAVAATLAWAFAEWAVARILAWRAGQRGGAGERGDAGERDEVVDPAPSAVGDRTYSAAAFVDRWGACWPVLVFSCLAVGQVLVSDGLMHSRPRLFLSGVLVLLVFAAPLARMRAFARAWVLAAWVLGSAWVGAYMLVPFPWAI
ncbi:hypothetical protein ACFORJ_04050 [Corynebacterium hansenii]|uniref:Integral membrane protein n=1 Tax=Corynebacterium hansenii TaxID=394964 RepID=A0ABV7ZME7_9CORY|nr:hypothetical protein [Corynebacterium hansenii]WJY98828.1 hypothetical protein CHAN_00955 [Corynebacterium hansenii]